jgi:hypothetical protein
VPNNQLAFLHKGEAVVPADINRRNRAESRNRGMNNGRWDYRGGEIYGPIINVNVLPGVNTQTVRQAAKMAADKASFARRRG